MPLSPGTRLGRYEILLPLGAGGMGEVYKARDTRLGRTVAIKVLPGHAAADPEVLRRFEREARAISAIDHPNICALYDVGHQDGVEFLVMQYLEGESLAARLQRGPLPFVQALAYGREITDALERAHAAGVIHRDLKPGNILLTADGAKLLDFGIARFLQVASPEALTSTLAGAEPVTAPGAILGTLPYMAPEQIAGHDADARTDIFALGVILYEMVCGRRPFDSNMPAGVVDAILHREPASLSSALHVPAWYDAAVRRCLAKRADDRWPTAAALKAALSAGTVTGASDNPAMAKSARRRITRRSATVLATVGVALVIGGVWAARTAILDLRESLTAAPPSGGRGFRPGAPPNGNSPRSGILEAAVPLHLSMALPRTLQIPPLGPELALSPDGRRIVFRARTAEGTLQLFLRSLDSTDVKPLAGTEYGRHAFWSPGGEAIGFFDDRKLKTVDIAGGAIQILCDAPAARGGAWSADRTIIFAPDTGEDGIYRVPDTGGTPQRVTAIDKARGQLAHTWPAFLPDGRRFLYTVSSAATGEGGTYLHSPNAGGDTRVLGSASNASYASGHLLFVTGGTLMTIAFDVDRGQTSGEPRALADGVQTNAAHSEFSATESVLAFWRTVQGAGRLTMVDRTGKVLHSIASATPIRDPALSPDERFVAYTGPAASGSGSDIWLLEWARGNRRRLTFDPASEYYPLWSPHARRLVFASNREGGMNLYLKELTGGAEDLLLKSDDEVYPTDWSKDGRFIVFEKRNEARTRDLWALELPGRGVRTIAATSADERQGRLSPDGRWMAYTANDSGRWEVYVRGFGDPSNVWQISTDGGVQPEWSPDGKELYYVNATRQLAVVRIRSGAGFDFAPPAPMFAIDIANRRPRSLYNVTPDGRRFVFSTQPVEDEELVSVITNWSAVDPRR
jgi:Tol biopolymer transport system component